MKKTNQQSDTSKAKTLRVRKETLRKLDDRELANVQGGLYDVHSFHSSCC